MENKTQPGPVENGHQNGVPREQQARIDACHQKRAEQWAEAQKRMDRQHMVFSMAITCGAVVAITFAAYGFSLLKNFLSR